MRARRPWPFVLALLIVAAPAWAAEVKLAAPFADHAVLQREKPVPVWGWAEAGETVTVEFGGASKTATADASGKWVVRLDPMPASAEPRTLVARGDKSKATTEAKDVLVGEVWLGSGQSNMAFTVARALDFDKEKAAAAKTPLIRSFKENSKAARAAQADATGSWAVCSEETVGNYSAALYFFGREVHQQLGVPVGLINSSVGGTPIESWIAGEAQAADPALKAAVEADAKADATFDQAKAKEAYAKQLDRWKEQAAKAKAAGQAAPRKPIDPVESRARRGGAGGLFNGKIAPLVPYAVRGVLWYQGEANSGSTARAALYQHQLALLVNDWRARWGDDQLPFAWAQLPNYGRSGEGWCLVREAELKTLRLPRTGMAVTVDVGESNDIHPRNKQEVGRRLALWALADVYGKKVDSSSGPLPAGHEVRGSDVVCAFKHADGGLVARGGGDVQGFQIAGEDRQWKPAGAKIDGDKVVVSSADVKLPVAVRYAWEADPKCNLFNGRGLPASPFRTDDWAPVAAPQKK